MPSRYRNSLSTFAIVKELSQKVLFLFVENERSQYVAGKVKETLAQVWVTWLATYHLGLEASHVVVGPDA